MVTFCPNAADWGNIADWVSGIGSMLAVMAAIGIAWYEVRRSRKAERQAAVTASRLRNAIIDEAKRLTEEARDKARDLVEAIGRVEPADLGSPTLLMRDYKDSMADTGQRLQQLQKMETVNPGLFTEIGHLASLCRVSYDPRTDNDVTTQSEARTLSRVLDNRLNTLEDMRIIYNQGE